MTTEEILTDLRDEGSGWKQAAWKYLGVVAPLPHMIWKLNA